MEKYTNYLGNTRAITKETMQMVMGWVTRHTPLMEMLTTTR